MINISRRSRRENQNTRFICKNVFFRISCLYDNMWKKYCTARQATDDIIKQRMHFECRVNKATDTHSELLYHGNSCYANTLQYYVYTYVASLRFAWTILYTIDCWPHTVCKLFCWFFKGSPPLMRYPEYLNFQPLIAFFGRSLNQRSGNHPQESV